MELIVAQLLHAHTRARARTQTQARTRSHAHTHSHTHTHAHTHTHTHTHTRTDTRTHTRMGGGERERSRQADEQIGDVFKEFFFWGGRGEVCGRSRQCVSVYTAFIRTSVNMCQAPLKKKKKETALIFVAKVIVSHH